MECDSPAHNTATSRSVVATKTTPVRTTPIRTTSIPTTPIHTTTIRTTPNRTRPIRTTPIRTSAPEPLERQNRRRTHSDVEPDSPVSPQITEIRMKQLLEEALSPLHAQLQDMQGTREKGLEKVTCFHEALATLKAENESLIDKLTAVEMEITSLKACRMSRITIKMYQFKVPRNS